MDHLAMLLAQAELAFPGIDTVIAAVPVIGVLVAWIADLRARVNTMKAERDDLQRQLIAAIQDSASLRGTVLLLENRLGERRAPMDD